MSRITTRMLKTALSALHYSGLGTLFAPLTRGHGVIFTLHQVLPQPDRDFDPNGILRVTPEFLEQVICQVREAGFEFLSLDAAAERISGATRSDVPFACFTLDDGYRDNVVHAYPILKRHNVPFTIYVPTDFPDGRGELWWLVLEAVIRRSPTVIVQMHGAVRTLACGTAAEKTSAFETIYWWLRGLPEARARQVVRELAAGAGVDIGGLCRDLIMTWDEIRQLASDPLVTIGAHTVRHYAVARLAADEARHEIDASMRRVALELGRPCRHFSFPYGDDSSAGAREFRMAAESGAVTAVTTRKGLIHSGHGTCLMSLPRVSLNGEYQNARYVEVLLTGAPFAFWNLFRRQSTVGSQ